MNDRNRIDRIIAVLISKDHFDDAEWLSERHEPRWWQLERRNAAILVATERITATSPTVIAKALQRALSRYVASAWRFDQATGQPALGNAALYRITLASKGRVIGWRTIYNIMCYNNSLGLQKSLEEVAIRRA